MMHEELLKQLFTSSARVDLMEYFFRNINKEIYMSMLKNDLGKNLSSYQKELDNLLKMGFLLERRQANLRIFFINTSFVLFAELRRVFYKTRLFPSILQYKLRDFLEIEYVFMYDKIVNSAPSRCLFVVCSDGADMLKYSNIMSSVLKDLACVTPFNIYPRAEMKRLLDSGDPLVAAALNAEKRMIKEG